MNLTAENLDESMKFIISKFYEENDRKEALEVQLYWNLTYYQLRDEIFISPQQIEDVKETMAMACNQALADIKQSIAESVSKLPEQDEMEIDQHIAPDHNDDGGAKSKESITGFNPDTTGSLAFAPDLAQNVVQKFAEMVLPQTPTPKAAIKPSTEYYPSSPAILERVISMLANMPMKDKKSSAKRVATVKKSSTQKKTPKQRANKKETSNDTSDGNESKASTEVSGLSYGVGIVHDTDEDASESFEGDEDQQLSDGSEDSTSEESSHGSEESSLH